MQNKMKARQILIIIVSLLFVQVNNLQAQSAKIRSFKMSVSGTSTMHNWESQVEKLDGKTSYKIEADHLIDIKEAVIKIPVQAIKSSKGKIMDNKTYEAFNSEKYPYIVFTLSSEEINPVKLTAALKGTLVMAGTTKQIDIVVKYRILANGDLQIIGTKKIKMTEFKMEPPTAMMGTITVGDEVTIDFDIILTSTTTNL
jgi:polyisoprenoid-binding protein YceI